jgi:hypothetical protein
VIHRCCPGREDGCDVVPPRGELPGGGIPSLLRIPPLGGYGCWVSDVDEVVLNLRELINDIPGENGWWHQDDGDFFYEAALELKGATDWEVEKIVDFLGCLYGAAANEFGG